MKRYCKKIFRDLVLGKSEINRKKIEKDIYEYIDECRKEAYRIENEYFAPEQWVKYGYDEAEKSQLMYNAIMGEDNLLFDDGISVENIKERRLSEREKFEIDVYNKDLRLSLRTLMVSEAVHNAIMSELYMAYAYLMSGTICLADGFTEDESDKISYHFENLHRGKITQKECPFDTELTELEQDISDFGSEILFLWLKSRTFRNIFVKVENRSKKYELENFYKCFMQEKKSILDYNGKEIYLTTNISQYEENDLILDKMIGGSIIIAVCKYLYPHIEDFNMGEIEEYVFDLLKKVMQCQSNHICCEILKIFHNEMERFKSTSKEFRIKKLLLYKEYVETVLPDIIEQFEGLCVVMADNIDIQWSEKAFKNYVENWKETRKRVVNGLPVDPYRIEYQKIDKYFDDYRDVKIIEEIIAFVTTECWKKY